MLPYPQFSPIAFEIGPLQVRWYGLMYLFGFTAAYILGRRRLRTNKLMSLLQFESVLTYAILGVVVGARLGYVLFYDLPMYLHAPLDIFKIWHGGMSFHGGLLGVLSALLFASHRLKIPFFDLVDFFAPLVPLGLFFGRLGNFINSELWGKPTEVPWGMVFPNGGALPRHPSQLYEAALEGIVLFIICWLFSSKRRPRMAVSGVFAIGYGVFRFCVEFFREPDAQIGYLAGGFFTMGMLLCVPLVITGVILLLLAYRKKPVSA